MPSSTTGWGGSTSAPMGDPGHLLVDARPIEHPTARRRGIGRYAVGLLQGLAEVGSSVTALASDTAEAALISPQVPGVEVVPWSTALVREHAVDGTWFISPALFLHPVAADPIPLIVSRLGLPVAAVMHDVIPYRYPEKFLTADSPRRMAALRKPLARTVDLWLCNSAFSKRTSIAELELDPSRVHVIGAGVEPMFQPPLRGARRPPAVPDQPYAICVTGTDEHKNTVGLVAAWGLLPSELRARHRLLIVGNAPSGVRRVWERAIERAESADSIQITGAVTDEHLVELLQHAELSITPSLEEGFGLPVLEAAACGCAAISSDRGSLPEVLDEPESCFDPTDPAAIAEAIHRAITNVDHREVLLAAGRNAAARQRWPHVAINALDVIDAHPIPVSRRRVPPSVLLVYGADMAAVGEQVAAAIGGLPGAPAVWQAVDVGGTDATSRPTAFRSPAGAIGRYPKAHEFDQVVVLGNAAVPAAVSAALRLLPPFDVAPVAALLPAG